MNEVVLYHIWQYKSYSHGSLNTVCGKPITIKSPGIRNRSSGPDFSMGKIILDGLEWAGPIEIHVKTSDWNLHKHNLDNAYSNVILHVVWENDMESPPGNIPVLELKGRVTSTKLHRYADLTELNDGIPCSSYHKELDPFMVNQWLNRMLVERLEERSELIGQWLIQTKNDWDEVAYRALLRSFGRKFNQQPFEELATALPYQILQKHITDRKSLLSLLLGVANLLHRRQNREELSQEFNFLKHRYNLEPMNTYVWKYGGVRPSSFPEKVLANFVEAISVRRLMSQWVDQVESGKANNPISAGDEKFFTKELRHHIFINAVLPVVFSYFQKVGRESECERITAIFSQFPKEKNSIVKKWKSLPLRSLTAHETQSLIQLFNKHCIAKKCLSCGIGNSILKHASS